MKNEKKNKQKKNGRPDTATDVIDVDPSLVRFTHSRIRPRFSGCGRLIQDTIDDLLSGKISIDALPIIAITIAADGHIFSLNNRRLYTIKQVHALGLLNTRNPPNTIKARVKPLLPRDAERYTIERCSLKATLMKDRPDAIEKEHTEDVEVENIDKTEDLDEF
eukprot:gene9221-19119_t